MNTVSQRWQMAILVWELKHIWLVAWWVREESPGVFLSIFSGLHFLSVFLNLQIASWMCLLLCLAILRLPCLSFHIPHLALICMGACVSLGVPDNLSEVRLKLMRGDSVRLQTPLINLSSSSCIVHANELFKCVTRAIPSGREKSAEDWVLN